MELPLKNVDHSLVSAFLERWHPETNNFHMSWGEMTITLHDVHRLTGLTIDGEGLNIVMDKADLVPRVAELMGWTAEKVQGEMRASGFHYTDMLTRLDELIADPAAPPEHAATIFLSILLGATLFIDKSSSRIKPHILPLVFDHQRTPKLAWGTGALAFLYLSLGQGSRVRAKRIDGFTSLLQVIIMQFASGIQIRW